MELEEQLEKIVRENLEWLFIDGDERPRVGGCVAELATLVRRERKSAYLDGVDVGKKLYMENLNDT